jgi:transposase
MNTKAETAAPALSSIGLDIGKDVFHLVGFDAKGKIILRKKIKRLALADTFKKIPPCIIGMEACPERTFRQPDLAGARP